MWNNLSADSDLSVIQRASFEKAQLIFKHSTRCGISAQAHANLEENLEDLAPHLDLHYLDLIQHRGVSNAIASEFGVPHQSPQVIVVKNGEVVYHASHFSIQPQQILQKTAA